MTTAVLHSAAAPFSALFRFFSVLGYARRYEHLFALSDSQLAARGFDRDALARQFIMGLSQR